MDFHETLNVSETLLRGTDAQSIGAPIFAKRFINEKLEAGIPVLVMLGLRREVPGNVEGEERFEENVVVHVLQKGDTVRFGAKLGSMTIDMPHNESTDSFAYVHPSGNPSSSVFSGRQVRPVEALHICVLGPSETIDSSSGPRTINTMDEFKKAFDLMDLPKKKEDAVGDFIQQQGRGRTETIFEPAEYHTATPQRAKPARVATPAPELEPVAAKGPAEEEAEEPVEGKKWGCRRIGCMGLIATGTFLAGLGYFMLHRHSEYTPRDNAPVGDSRPGPSERPSPLSPAPVEQTPAPSPEPAAVGAQRAEIFHDKEQGWVAVKWPEGTESPVTFTEDGVKVKVDGKLTNYKVDQYATEESQGNADRPAMGIAIPANAAEANTLLTSICNRIDTLRCGVLYPFITDAKTATEVAVSQPSTLDK